METINHDFDADLASIGMKFCATGFAGSCQFVSVRVGNRPVGGGEYTLLITMDEARAIADAVTRAADFAEGPRVASAADLGIAA